jgi:hypothetical protein
LMAIASHEMRNHLTKSSAQSRYVRQQLLMPI